MEVSGIVTKLLTDEKIESKKKNETYRKRQFLLQYQEGKYSNDVAMEIFGKANERIPEIHVGNRIKVTFSLFSNEWNGKYFTKASVIYVDIEDMQHEPNADWWAAGNDLKPKQELQMEINDQGHDDKEDDLPF